MALFFLLKSQQANFCGVFYLHTTVVMPVFDLFFSPPLVLSVYLSLQAQEELDKRRKEIEDPDGMPDLQRMDDEDGAFRDDNDPITNAGAVYDTVSTFLNSESSLEGVEVNPEVSEVRKALISSTFPPPSPI